MIIKPDQDDDEDESEAEDQEEDDAAAAVADGESDSRTPRRRRLQKQPYAFLYSDHIIREDRDTRGSRDFTASLASIRKIGPHLKPPMPQSTSESLAMRWAAEHWLTRLK